MRIEVDEHGMVGFYSDNMNSEIFLNSGELFDLHSKITSELVDRGFSFP